MGLKSKTTALHFWLCCHATNVTWNVIKWCLRLDVNRQRQICFFFQGSCCFFGYKFQEEFRYQSKSFQDVFRAEEMHIFPNTGLHFQNCAPLSTVGFYLTEVLRESWHKLWKKNKTLWLTYNSLVITLHLYIIQLFSEWRQLFILWLLLSLDGFRLVWRHFRYFFQPWHFHLQVRLRSLQWLDTARHSCVRVLRDRV